MTCSAVPATTFLKAARLPFFWLCWHDSDTEAAKLHSSAINGIGSETNLTYTIHGGSETRFCIKRRVAAPRFGKNPVSLVGVRPGM